MKVAHPLKDMKPRARDRRDGDWEVLPPAMLSVHGHVTGLMHGLGQGPQVPPEPNLSEHCTGDTSLGPWVLEGIL